MVEHKGEQVQEQQVYEFSQQGVEVVASDILAKIWEKADERHLVHTIANPNAPFASRWLTEKQNRIARLAAEADLTAAVLDKVVPRSDGSTWLAALQEEHESSQP